jgi:hypothetical protein
MNDFIRRFRGFGVAAVVLALSAGAVFASSAGLPSQAAGHASDKAVQVTSNLPTNAPETEDPTEEPTETPETEDPTETPATEDATTAPQDTHGALVSAAAQMETPLGFANHGAFVSCVAHMMDVTLATIDWTTVTPDTCGATQPDATAGTNSKAEAGKATGAAGRANGAAHRAAAQAGH